MLVLDPPAPVPASACAPDGIAGVARTAAGAPACAPDGAAVPLHWRRGFPGEASQARAVRRFVSCLLEDCCSAVDEALCDDVLLAVDELVVNALRHTRSGRDGGSFTVEVTCAGAGGVTVSVTDQGGPADPVAGDADVLAESGRGLRTISRLAQSWGWYGNESGRTVTALFVRRGRVTEGGAEGGAEGGTGDGWSAVPQP